MAETGSALGVAERIRASLTVRMNIAPPPDQPARSPPNQKPVTSPRTSQTGNESQEQAEQVLPESPTPSHHEEEPLKKPAGRGRGGRGRGRGRTRETPEEEPEKPENTKSESEVKNTEKTPKGATASQTHPETQRTKQTKGRGRGRGFKRPASSHEREEPVHTEVQQKKPAAAAGRMSAKVESTETTSNGWQVRFFFWGGVIKRLDRFHPSPCL